MNYQLGVNKIYTYSYIRKLRVWLFERPHVKNRGPIKKSVVDSPCIREAVIKRSWTVIINKNNEFDTNERHLIN